MSPLTRIALVIMCWFTLSSISAQELQSDICGHSASAFVDGEMLRYKLYYNLSFLWIPAGEVTFHITETDSTYEANIEGRSYGSYDNIFRVRDQFHTSIDRESMLPIAFVRKVEEGNHRRYDSLTFDYKHDVIYSLNGDSMQSAVWDTFNLEQCTQDLVSVMYNLRNIPTENYGRGDVIKGNIFFDKEYSPLTIQYLKKQRKNIKGLGKYHTIKIRPEIIIGSVFKEGDIMNIWVSDDGNKIPLLIESPIMIGKVKAVLMDYSGLQYPLAKVEK